MTQVEPWGLILLDSPPAGDNCTKYIEPGGHVKLE
jgi:hypothetical protein